MDLDFAKCRKTQDGLVSVIDVIASVKQCDHIYAAKTYRRMLEEDRINESSMRPYGSLLHDLQGDKMSPAERGCSS